MVNLAENFGFEPGLSVPDEILRQQEAQANAGVDLHDWCGLGSFFLARPLGLVTFFCRESEMQVAITCRHGSIRQDLRDYITQKAEKLLRFLDTVSEIDVTLEFEAARVDVELLVEIDGYHSIVAHVEGEDSKATFDKALHKMEYQVHKYKEKHRDRRHTTSVSDAVREAEEKGAATA